MQIWVLKVLSLVSLATPALTALVNMKQRFTVLWSYLVIGFSIDIAHTIVKFNTSHNYFWLGNAFFVLEFVFIATYYYRILAPGNKVIPVFIFLGALIFIADTTYESIWELNTNGAAFICGIYIVLGLIGYLNIINKHEHTFVGRSSFFWANTGFFIYSSSVLMVFLFRKTLQEEDLRTFNKVWQVFFIPVNIFRYVCIGLALKKSSQ